MPELPEVEITRRGLAPVLAERTITSVVVRHPRLRWPIPRNLGAILKGARIRSIRRRAKYLLLDCGKGTLILHLGMSGSLRMVPAGQPAGPYDHFDLTIGSLTMRLRDPRRFGAVLWHAGDPAKHPLLAGLGVEPLSDAFTGQTLHRATRGRRAAIKHVLMDARRVAGVGNIYASESLFRARIHPSTPAHGFRLPAASASLPPYGLRSKTPSPQAGARCATLSSRTARPVTFKTSISSTTASVSPA